MPRLFTGISLPDTLRDELGLCQSGLQGARWIERGDLHLTLRFFGDMSPQQANELAEALQDLSFAPFQLQLEGVGVFGSKAPRMVYVTALPTEALLHLQRAHEVLAQRLGFPPERRKFTPHITLARVRRSPVHAVRDYLSRQLSYAHLSFEVQGFELFSSKESRGGGPYVVEGHYPASVA